jgi:hypothetical protein
MWIKLAGFAGIILALLTLVQMLFVFAGFSLATFVGFILHARAESSGKALPEIGGASGFYLIINIASFMVVAALTLGVFKKIKWCAVLLTVYCAITFLLSIPAAIFLFGIPSIILAALTLFIFWGTKAIFKFHKSL